MLLLVHQLVIGRCVQASGPTPSATFAADAVKGLSIDPQELAEFNRLLASAGFRLTRRVQRSWCTVRTASTAPLTLSLLPAQGRRQLIGDWVEAGGGKAFDPASEAEEFLEFVANSLTDPSHALSVCRMEQAAYRASEAALRFRPPDLSLLDDPDTVLRTGSGSAMVLFFAEPRRLFDTIAANEPLPPLSQQHFPVLFAPGLPKLYRAASEDEYAFWDKLASPSAVPISSCESYTREVLGELFKIGAAELAGITAPQAAAVQIGELSKKRGPDAAGAAVTPPASRPAEGRRKEWFRASRGPSAHGQSRR